MPYQLANKTFKTKEKITNYFKYILNHTTPDTALNGLWEKEVIELIKHHPDAKDKIGAGIKEIRVEFHFDLYTNNLSKYPHFHIYRVDGTDIDFSYYVCLRNLPNTSGKFNSRKRDETEISLFGAFRFEVKEYVYKHKKDYFGNCMTKKCQVTGKRIAISKAEVDHIPPLTFAQIVFNFLSLKNIDAGSIKLNPIDGYYKNLADRELAKEWYDYHKANAQLRVVASYINRTQSKSKDIPWSSVGLANTY